MDSQALVSLIEAQISAYNEKDLERFLSFYSQEPVIECLDDPSFCLKSRDEIRETYRNFFSAHPNVKGSITSRIIQPPFVIDQEHLTGYSDGSERVATVIYKLEGSRISRVWMCR